MFDELRSLCLVDIIVMVLGSFIIGALSGIFVGFAVDDSDRAYKLGQQSCAVCEVIKNAK